MDDAVVVQVGDAGAHAAHPPEHLIFGDAVGVALDYVFERLAGDVFHDDPLVAHFVGADVVQRDQVGVLQVEALGDAAELDIQIAADELERDFFAGVAGGEIDFAEAAPPDAALDRVAFQRPRAAGVGEFDRRGTRPLGVFKLRRLRIHGRKVLTF